MYKFDKNQESSDEILPLETYGLYCRIQQRANGLTENDVFRFFENGDVLNAHVAQRKAGDGYFPKEYWFNWDNHKTYSSGRWKRNGNGIDITIRVSGKNIRYSGTLKLDGMILDSCSELTGNREERVEYEYYPFAEVPGWWD